jgi:hypothetical protein
MSKFILGFLILFLISAGAKPPPPPLPKKTTQKQSVDIVAPAKPSVDANEVDRCPIISKEDPSEELKNKKSIEISFDVDVTSEMAFMSCEKKIIKEDLCSQFPKAKKITVRLRSSLVGSRGTEGQIIGDCIKSRKPAAIQNGKKIFTRNFVPRTPLRLERKIKPSEIDYDEGY